MSHLANLLILSFHRVIEKNVDKQMISMFAEFSTPCAEHLPVESFFADALKLVVCFLTHVSISFLSAPLYISE
jgi:hypothetical protein